ncbi:MAG: ethanolamine utilization protein, partial [Cetobacterium sp.]
MVLTEEKLRSLYKKDENMKEISLEKGTILTPSARQFLIDKDIKVVDKIAGKTEEAREFKEIRNEESKPKYKGILGELYVEKPEYMTQIYGNVLVKKDDKRIIFRGVIDSFQSRWLVLMKDLEEVKNAKLQKDLESIEKFIKNILVSEVIGEALVDIKVLEKS